MNGFSTTITASQARSNFYSLLDQVDGQLKRFTITKKGKAKAMVVPIDDVSSCEETMEIMVDKKLIKDIKAGLVDIRKGHTISEDQLLKKAGILQ